LRADLGTPGMLLARGWGTPNRRRRECSVQRRAGAPTYDVLASWACRPSITGRATPYVPQPPSVVQSLIASTTSSEASSCM
jgi:hypothetical protein